MANMPSQRFSTAGFDFVNGQREGAAAIALARERAAKSARAASTPRERSPSRVRPMTVETTAQQIYADACRLYADGQYAQARMKLLRLVGGALLADEGHYGLACIAVATGDPATARSHLLRAVAVNPRHRRAVSALQRIGR